MSTRVGEGYRTLRKPHSILGKDGKVYYHNLFLDVITSLPCHSVILHPEDVIGLFHLCALLSDISAKYSIFDLFLLSQEQKHSFLFGCLHHIQYRNCYNATEHCAILFQYSTSPIVTHKRYSMTEVLILLLATPFRLQISFLTSYTWQQADLMFISAWPGWYSGSLVNSSTRLF